MQALNIRTVWLRWVIVLCLSLAGLVLLRQVELSENALDLLPGEAVRGDLKLLERLGLMNRVFISLEYQPQGERSPAAAQAALQDSAERIGRALAAEELFQEVVYRLPAGYDLALLQVLFPSLPALLTEQDLKVVEKRLAPERLRHRLADHFALLNSPAGFALKEQLRRDPLGLTDILLARLRSLRGELDVNLADGFFLSREGTSCLVWTESALPLMDSRSAALVQARLETILAEGLHPRVTASIIGALPHTLANARIVQQDLQRLLPVASLLLLALLLGAFRTWRGLLVMAIPFLAAPLAVSVVHLTAGTMSAMALGFGIVLLGISVDFAIHLYLSLSQPGVSGQAALRHLRRPVLLAFCTTIGVFMVLLFSTVPSHRQMAALAIVGITLAILFAWLLVPTIAGIQPPGLLGRIALRPSGARPLPFAVLVGWMVLVGMSLGLWPQLRYNGDLRVLDVPVPEIEADEELFRSTWRQEIDQAFVVAEGNSLEEALRRNDQIDEQLRSRSVAGYQTLAGILPSSATQARHLAAWRDFWASRRPEVTQKLRSLGEEAGFSPQAFAPFLAWLEQEPATLQPRVLLASPLRPLLSSFLQLEDHGAPGGEQGALVVTIAPDTPELRTAMRALQTVDPGIRLLSPASWRARIEDLLRVDIGRLSLAAAFLVVILLALFFRSPRKVLAALSPVLSALAAMVLFSFLTSGQLNLMHVLMSLMVIGISVDYGIFVVNTHRKPISGSTLTAVSLCAASTLSGFGVLALARHPALHSLGTTVLVGITAAWPTALWIAPALLSLGRRR